MNVVVSRKRARGEYRLPTFRAESNEAPRIVCGNCTIGERYDMACGPRGRVESVSKTFSAVDESEIRGHLVAEKIAEGSG